MRRNSLVHSGNLALALDQAQYRGLKFCAMKIAAFQPSGKGKKCGGRPADIADPGPAGVERDHWKPLPPSSVKNKTGVPHKCVHPKSIQIAFIPNSRRIPR